MNKVCLSGMSAIALANQSIQLGEYDVVVAGGMESMSNAPYVLPKARTGYRMGNGELVDSMIHDGLWCAFDDGHMGEGSDKVNTKLEISREAQDEWSAMSATSARSPAWKDGKFADEVIPVEVPQRKGDPDHRRHRRGHAPRHHRRVPVQAVAAFNRETARSPPATRRRSPTAAPPWCSRAAPRPRSSASSRWAASCPTAPSPGPDVSLHHQPADAIREGRGRRSTPTPRAWTCTR